MGGHIGLEAMGTPFQDDDARRSVAGMGKNGAVPCRCLDPLAPFHEAASHSSWVIYSCTDWHVAARYLGPWIQSSTCCPHQDSHELVHCHRVPEPYLHKVRKRIPMTGMILDNSASSLASPLGILDGGLRTAFRKGSHEHTACKMGAGPSRRTQGCEVLIWDLFQLIDILPLTLSGTPSTCCPCFPL